MEIKAFKKSEGKLDRSITFEWNGQISTISWEDMAFLEHIKKLNYGRIETIKLVNGHVQSFEDPKKNIKIF